MITFTETTGILNKDDIRRKTRIWEFDAASGMVKRTWWISDSEFKSDEEDYDNSIPLTINIFTNRYLDSSIGRCAALNGADNFILMEDGGWDRPLHDDDFVMLVPAVGLFGIDYLIYAVVIIMIAAMAYCLYITANIKTGDGAGSTTVYSLSSMTNKKRPGDVVERQYGYCKRYPSYAANPYTKYSNNVQWLYAIFCVGTGDFYFDENDPYGFGHTNYKAYSDLSISVIKPFGYAGEFDNNILTSSEVSDGLELIPYNEGLNAGDDGAWEDAGYVGPNGYRNFSQPYGDEDGWFGWFTANEPGTSASKIFLDFCFPNGLGHTNNDGDGEKYSVYWQAQYRSITKSDTGYITYGTPVTVFYSKRKSTNTQLRYTELIEVPNGAYQVRCRRTSKRDALNSANGQRTRETLQWTALRAKLPNKTSFGNRTVIMVKARAQNGLTDSAAKRFYVKGTGYTHIYNTTTKAWTDTPNRNPVWASCDMLRSSNGGKYPDSILPLEHLASWAAWCDTNEVYFDYCFDDQSDIDTQMKIALRVMRASPIYTNGQFHVLRDEPITIPVEIFTSANIVAGSLKIQYKGRTTDDYDGLRVEYSDENDDWNTNTVDCLRSGSTGSNLKTTTLKGCTDRTQAYRIGMYEWITEIENRAAISFTSTKVGWQCEPGAMIYLNHPMFRQHDDGRIVAIDGTTVTLDRNVNLNSEYNNIFLIRNCKTGGELGRYVATYTTEGDYHTLTLDSAPDATGMEFYDPQALPVFALGIATNFAKKCRVTKMQNKQDGTDIECFIDTDARFAYDSLYPDVDIPAVQTVIPGTPANVTATPVIATSEEIASGFSVPSCGCSYMTSEGELIYVTNYSDNSISRSNSDGTYSIFASGVNTPMWICVGDGGNLYVTSFNTKSLIKITSSGVVTTLCTFDDYPYCCVFYASGQIFITFPLTGTIKRFTLETGTLDTFASGMGDISGLVYTRIGLLGSSPESGNIYIIDPTTGNFSILWQNIHVGDICPSYIPEGSNNTYHYLYGIKTDLLDDETWVSTIYDIYVSDGVAGFKILYTVPKLLTGPFLYDNATGKLAACVPYENTLISIPTSSTPSDITISWDAVSGFDTYIVQYSQDDETWTTLTGSTTATSALVGSYMSGYFYARVAVVYNGCVWSWGTSAATWMPSSTSEFVYVTSDNFVDTTSDGYKMVFQGES